MLIWTLSTMTRNCQDACYIISEVLLCGGLIAVCSNSRNEGWLRWSSSNVAAVLLVDLCIWLCLALSVMHLSSALLLFCRFLAIMYLVTHQRAACGQHCNLSYNVPYCLISFDVCTHFWHVQGTSEVATKRAALLSDMHLRNLRQKLQIKQRMDEISKKLEVCFDLSCKSTLHRC